MTVKIRSACSADAPALSRICLLTADAGKSAEHLHDYPELPGLVWALPYVELPTTWGFVMESDGKVVGYIVGSKDTPTYETYARTHRWPALSQQYPPEAMRQPADQSYAALLTNFRVLPKTTLDFASAHIHIDILPSYQGQGWGRRLIEHAFEYLQHQDVDGVWLITNPRNVAAGAFYRKMGFESIPGSPENHLGLRFAEMEC
uniref:N-acetyltransferase domain-containing protein n=1 Tax=Mycena chlorophos TaxID=658473 RepID=A0ABQ0L4K7_MYCCL|nr:predicted protein [Mycena chlorophos]